MRFICKFLAGVVAFVAAGALAEAVSASVLTQVPSGDALLTVQVVRGDAITQLIVDQGGRILVMQNGHQRSVPFLDLGARTSASGESGLLSMALHPDFLAPGAAGEGLVWIFFTEHAPTGGIDKVVRFHVPRGRWMVDLETEREVMSWRAGGCHHGGHLLFGPRGESPAGPLLYVSVGDACGNVPGTSPRDTTSPQGKILRVQPALDEAAAPPWTAPSDNPGAGEDGMASAWWARGLRNPWRCAFDALTGALWIADVGTGIDEADIVPSGTPGMDFGWNVMEGRRCVTAGCTPVGVAPVLENFAPGTCAIIGGTVPRGEVMPWLDGQFVFSDNCSKDVYAADSRLDGTWRTRIITSVPDYVTDVSPGDGGAPVVSTRNYWGRTARVWSLGRSPDPLRGPRVVPAFWNSASARPPLLVARGGLSAPSWELLSGTLPAGVSFDSSGLRADSPAVRPFQTRTVRVRASNSDGEVVDGSACLVHADTRLNLRFAVPAMPPPMLLVLRREDAAFTQVRLVITWRQPHVGPFHVVLRNSLAFVDTTVDPTPDATATGFFHDNTVAVSGSWELVVTTLDGSDASSSVASWVIDGPAKAYGCSDEDGDGIASVIDACSAFADQAQQDSDGNGIGDACDIAWGDVAPAGAPDGRVDVADAVWALRASVGLVTPDAEQLRRGDVAPYDAFGPLARPWADDPSAIDVADVVTILRASVGLLQFDLPR